MTIKETLSGLWQVIKNNQRGIITVLIVAGMFAFFQGCMSSTKSLIDPNTRVSREELQLELETLQSRAEIGMADLDRQDAIKAMVFQNALILASGGVLNPLSILTGIAAIYGVAAAGGSVVTAVKKSNADKQNGTVVV